MQDQKARRDSFRAVLALDGFAAAIGIFVVLTYARIPFFLYYPRLVNTVLLSDALDLYAFFAAGFCVPLSMGILALRHRLRELTHDVLLTHLAVLGLWLASLALALYSVPAAVFALFASVACGSILNLLEARLVLGKALRRTVSTFLLPFTTIFAMIEFASVYFWAFAAVDPLTQVGRQAAELEANLTYSLFPLAPIILVAVLFSWALIPVAARLLRVKKEPPTPSQSSNSPVDRRAVAAAVDLILIVAIAVFYFPYAAGQGWIVGVDSIMNYVDPMVRMSGMSFGVAFRALAATFHGVYVGILFAVHLGTGFSPFSVVKFTPLALLLLTAITMFWVFYRFGRSYRLAVLCAVSAVLWIPGAWGIFAGLQANWLAVWLWILFLGAMLAWLNRIHGGWIYLLIQAVVSAAVLLVHPWTWGLFLGTLVIFTLITLMQKSRARRRSIMSLVSVVSLAVPAGVISMILFPGLRKDLLNAATLYIMPLLDLRRILVVWNSLAGLLDSWSSFLSPTILTICLLGSVGLYARRDLLGRYVSVWLFVSSLSAILAGMVGFNPNQPGPPDPLIWRVLYVSPFGILLAFGVEMIFLISARLEVFAGSQSPRILEGLVPMVAIGLSSGFLLASSPVLRTGGVIVALLLAFLAASRFSEARIVRILVALIVVLVVVNAAFRGLYPLLLDPHNLYR